MKLSGATTLTLPILRIRNVVVVKSSGPTKLVPDKERRADLHVPRAKNPLRLLLNILTHVQVLHLRFTTFRSVRI
jgi:hypothetical protein